MKIYTRLLFIFFICSLILYSIKVKAILPLTGYTIIIDPGHGGEDPGTVYNSILEKELNLKISLNIKKELIKMGANVIMTRDDDYDLSKPSAIHRKKSDFDNRIKLINESNSNLYLSIHLNHLNDTSYYGPQVFYTSNNKKLANIIQGNLNVATKTNRSIKLISSDIYMYNKLNIDGVLIECGFLSNEYERNLLLNNSYRVKISKDITKSIIEYYNS